VPQPIHLDIHDNEFFKWIVHPQLI